jgi:Rieske Fe-S protein
LEQQLPINVGALRTERAARDATTNRPHMSYEPHSDTDASRRTFLGTCSTMLQAAVVGCALAPFVSSCGPSRIAARQLDDGRIEVNVALLVADRMSAVVDRLGPDGKGIVVVRQAADNYIAMSMKCTHKGCSIEAPNDEGTMICPCHDSRFDLGGEVIKPPATTPLKRYDTSFDADARALYIRLS